MYYLLSSVSDVRFIILCTRCTIYYLVYPTYYLLSSVMYYLISSVPDVLFIILCTRGTVYYLVYPMYYFLSCVPDVLFII